MRRKPVFIGPIVDIDLCWDVDHDRFFLADALPPMIDPLRHLDQQGVVDSNEKLIGLASGWESLRVDRTGRV